MPVRRRLFLVFALLIAGPAVGRNAARAFASAADGQPQGSTDAALAAAFEQCWDLAATTLQDPLSLGPAADVESRIAAIVRGDPDPPALIRALARSVEIGIGGGNVAHLALGRALGNVLSDPVVRVAAIWHPDGCPPETRRRLLKLAILGGGDPDPVTGMRHIRAGQLDPAEIVGPLARASTPGETWALGEAVLDQARAHVRGNFSAKAAFSVAASDAALRGWCGALIEALREPATPVARFWLGWTLHSLLTPEADTISEDADAWAETLAAIPAGDAVPRHLQLRTSKPSLLDLFWAGAPMSYQEIWLRDDDRLPADRTALEALVALNPHHPDLLGMHAVVCERLGAYEAADRSFAALADILGRDLTYAEYRFYAAIRHGMFSERRLLHLLEARQAGRRGRGYAEMVPELYPLLVAHGRFAEARALFAEGPPGFKTAQFVAMGVQIALAGAVALVMGSQMRRRALPFPSLRQAALLTACFVLINMAATLVLGIWLGFIAAAVVVVGAYLLMKDRPGPDAEGFRWPGAVGGVLLPAAVVVGGVAVASGWHWLLSVSGVEPQPQLGAEALRGQQGAGLAVAVAAVVVAAPVAEELLFRRLWFPVLRQRYGAAVGIAASACLFAAVHGDVQAFVPLAALGAGFAWLYHRSRSLVGCTVAHALNNALAVATTALWG